MIKRFACLVCLTCVFSCNAWSESSALSVLATKMLVQDNLNIRKMSAKIIHKENINDHKVLDLLAYRLEESQKKFSDIDLAAWYAKALSASDDGRYLIFLNQMHEAYSNEKIKSHISKSIKSTTKKQKKSKKQALSYSSVNIEDMVSAAEQDYRSRIVDERTMGGLKVGSDISSTLNQLGLPERIEQELVTVRRPYVGNIITQRLVLKYNGLSNVRLGYAGKELLIERITQTIALSPELASSKYGRYISSILTGTPQQYRETALTVYRQRLFSDELMDAAAKRIWIDRNTKDRHAIDGVAWLLNCISQSGNPRYRTFLTEVMEQTSVKKIRKYAKRAKTTLLDTEVDQFSI